MKVKFEGFREIQKTWEFMGADEAKKEMVQNQVFKNELKRHNIGTRFFMSSGGLHQADFNNAITVTMEKYRGTYNYIVCKINSDSLESKKPPTDRERLLIEAEKREGEEYFVEVCRKYFYVCRNNGAFHKGDAGHLGGYATFIGKFDADGVRIDRSGN